MPTTPSGTKSPFCRSSRTTTGGRHQIKSRVRNQIRKAEKEGLVVKEVPYDDDFVRGMTAIFNESPVRQGRPFWHYGKSFETVK